MSNRLADAIVLARDFLRRHPELLSQRLPPEEGEVSEGFAVAIHEPLEGASLKAAVTDHARAARGQPSFEVKVIVVPPHVAQQVIDEDGTLKAPDRDVRCIFSGYPDRAEIRVMGNLNRCWTRFVICKEMAHLIMGRGDGLRTKVIETQLRMALSIGLEDPDEALSAEEFAWFMAAELMIPFADRRNWAPDVDSHTLARRHVAPKAIVDMLRSAPHVLEASDAAERLRPS